MHRLRILGIFAALALLIAACGDPTPPAGTHALTVEVVGAGTVTFDASGDSAVGTNNVAAGEVTLVATPEPGSVFDGWTGDVCVGEGATCTFTLDSDTTITATFLAEGDDTHQLTVAVAGDGTGTVEFDVAGGDDAIGTHDIADGEEVTLVATATTGDFAGWTGDACVGEGATCTFTVDGDISVTANFNVPGGDTFDLTVEVDGAGTGTVTFGPGGDDAVGTTTFDEGEVVVLVATATTGSFAGWTGDACAGQGVTCSFAITADTTVTATFSDAAPTSGFVAIASGEDDGLEWVTDANNADAIPQNSAGFTHNSLPYLGVGYTARWEAETAGGFIFRNLEIPAGSIITGAYIQFTSIEATSGSCPEPGCMDAGDSAPANLIVRAVADTSPAAIPTETDADPILSRPFVAATADWVVPEWTTKGANGEDQATSDLTSLLQEVVDLETWGSESDDVMFVIQNNDGDALEGFRQVATFEEGGDAIPVLHFTYTPPAP